MISSLLLLLQSSSLRFLSSFPSHKLAVWLMSTARSLSERKVKVNGGGGYDLVHSYTRRKESVDGGRTSLFS